MNSERATLGIVVLNWNGAEDTLECLRSLRASRLPLHAIVVDNGSTDDSVRRIDDAGLADTLIENGANLGYAEGNNVGLRHAMASGLPMIGVLNNDTIVSAEAFGTLATHLVMGEHRALSPDIRYFHDPFRSWFAGGVVDRGWPRHLQPSELPADDGPLRPSECLTGCCIVARSETWQHVGLFDDRYFLLFEDSEWSVRARCRGVPLYVVTESVIGHKVSRSFAAPPSSLLAGFYFARNGLLFESRHAPRYLLRFVLRWLIKPALAAMVRPYQRPESVFLWLGALAFASGRWGRAPGSVERLARRMTRTGVAEPLGDLTGSGLIDAGGRQGK